MGKRRRNKRERKTLYDLAEEYLKARSRMIDGIMAGGCYRGVVDLARKPIGVYPCLSTQPGAMDGNFPPIWPIGPAPQKELYWSDDQTTEGAALLLDKAFNHLGVKPELIDYIKEHGELPPRGHSLWSSQTKAPINVFKHEGSQITGPQLGKHSMMRGDVAKPFR